MTCGGARRLLWPDAGPRPTTDEVERAQSHLEECADCRRFMEDMGRVSDWIGEHAPEQETPDRLREQVSDALARERVEPQRGTDTSDANSTSAQRSRTVVGLAGLLLLMLAAGAVWFGGDGRGSALLDAVAEDHLQAVNREELRTRDRSEARSWLQDRVSFAVEVPRLPAARISGARLCFLGGRRGAVVEYRVDGSPVSYYVMPTDGERSPREEADAFRSEARSGYHVVAWRQAGMTHALVGALPRTRLSELAHACSDQLSARKPSHHRRKRGGGHSEVIGSADLP